MSYSKKSSTPRSGKRKRRGISPIASDQASPASNTKKAKRNLDFSEKTEEEEASAQDKISSTYLTLILKMKKNKELT